MPSETASPRETRPPAAPFFGREDALAELARLAAGDRNGRGWVFLTGSPGSGKSALLERYRDQLETTGELAAYHALRRDVASSDRPEIALRSLAAQIEAIHPAPVEGEARRAGSLVELLGWVSMHKLVPRKERLIVILDGIEDVEIDRGGKNPLPRFLPSVLPQGVVLIASVRPSFPYIAWLHAREGVRGLSLDSPRWAASNEQACQAFWAHHASRLDPPLDPPLDASLIEQALSRGRGNLLYALTLRERFAQDPESRRAERLPEGLDGLCESLRNELFAAPSDRAGPVARALGLLAAAREALPLAAIGEALGLSDALDEADLPVAARILLRKEPEGKGSYRFSHPMFRDLVASALGEAAMVAQHRLLSSTLAAWPQPDRRNHERRRYALRHAISHAIEAGDRGQSERLCKDLDFLEVKCREESSAGVEGDLRKAISSSPGEAVTLSISALHRAICAEAAHLRERPDALPGLVYNRLRSSGWTKARIEASFFFPRGLPAPRLRHPVLLDQGVALTLSGHSAEVNACAITPDGTRVVSASSDRTLKVWDLETGQLISTLTGHTDEVTACALSPDGARAVSAASDRTVRIWDLATERCLATLKRRSERVNACVVTPDGALIVCAADGDVVQVWDIASGRCVKTLPGYAEEISARSLSQDGQTVFSSSYDSRIEVWKLATGLLDTLLIGHSATVNACALCPDGRRAVSASYDGTIRVWDLRSGELLRTLGGHSAGVNACALTPDGKRLLSASADHRLKLWDLETGQLIDTLTGHTESVDACAVSPGGEIAVSASADHTLKIWALSRSQAARAAHGGEVNACAVAAGGETVVTASADKTLKVWDARTGELKATLSGHSAGVNACALTPDGRRIVSASYDRSLKVWDARTGELLSTLTGHGAGVNACAVTPDGKRVVSASYDKTLHIWDLATGKTLATLSGHTDFVNACALTPDGRAIISASADKTLRIWDAESGKALSTSSGHTAGVNACAVTSDGLHAISASYDKTMRVWDLRTGKTVKILPGHAEGVTACAITADARTLVSASYDGTLRVWDLETGDCLGRTLGLCPFRSVAVASGLIAAGDAQGNVWMLDLPDPQEIAPASSGRPSLDSV